MKRVVITGIGAVSPLGGDVSSLVQGIQEGKSAVRYMEEWSRYFGLSSHVAAPAELKDENRIPRQKRRSMGRMSIFAAQAAEQALGNSGINLPDVAPGRIGCIIGSTMGSSINISDTFEILIKGKDISQIPSGMVRTRASIFRATSIRSPMAARKKARRSSVASWIGCSSSLLY